MKLLAFLALSTTVTIASARPTQYVKREVPQEHSHEQFLTTVQTFLQMNNPLGIVDPVFGLLGDAAAAGGAGKVTNLDCLQQESADQAFTNAKAAGSVEGMTAALIYRTLERNTGAVGLASVLCTETATNPEIAALKQHQDPASDNAAAINKQIALDLAVQISIIGGDPQDAIKSGTFAPGTIGDPTAKGNTCDDANDPVGCIFTQNLLVPDVTTDEINAAVAASGSPTSSESDVAETDAASQTDIASETDTAATATETAATDAADSTDVAEATDTADDCDNVVDVASPTEAAKSADKTKENDTKETKSSDMKDKKKDKTKHTKTHTGTHTHTKTHKHTHTKTHKHTHKKTDAVEKTNNTSSAVTATSTSAASSNGTSVCLAAGDLGGPPPVVTQNNSSRPFAVDGSTFLNKAAACGRACDVQHNACADAANSGANFTVGDCDQQDTACKAANGIAA